MYVVMSNVLFKLSVLFLLCFSSCKVKTKSDYDTLNGFLSGTVLENQIQEVKRYGDVKSASYSFLVSYNENLKRSDLSSLRLQEIENEDSKVSLFNQVEQYFDAENIEDFNTRCLEGVINDNVWVRMVLIDDKAFCFADRF